MRLLLISCDVFHREMCAAAARSPHKVDLRFMPKGLHDIGADLMRQRLQEAIDAVDASDYDAIILGYGLCNNGVHHLVAPAIPLVLARAHDCMTLFFGSRERYQSYFDANPGAYFQTTGWMERGTVTGELKQLSIGHKTGMDQSYEELAKKYGEDNARYLWDTLCDTLHNYRQGTFIAMGVCPEEPFEAACRQECERRRWKFDRVQGDMGLIDRLLSGDWRSEDFLVVSSGSRVKASHDSQIVSVEHKN